MNKKKTDKVKGKKAGNERSLKGGNLLTVWWIKVSTVWLPTLGELSQLSTLAQCELVVSVSLLHEPSKRRNTADKKTINENVYLTRIDLLFICQRCAINQNSILNRPHRKDRSSSV